MFRQYTISELPFRQTELAANSFSPPLHREAFILDAEIVAVQGAPDAPGQCATADDDDAVAAIGGGVGSGHCEGGPDSDRRDKNATESGDFPAVATLGGGDINCVRATTAWGGGGGSGGGTVDLLPMQQLATRARASVEMKVGSACSRPIAHCPL